MCKHIPWRGATPISHRRRFSFGSAPTRRGDSDQRREAVGIAAQGGAGAVIDNPAAIENDGRLGEIEGTPRVLLDHADLDRRFTAPGR